MARRFRALAVLAARAAEEKKSEHIVLKHLRGTALAEYLLLATVNSPAQMEAVEEYIRAVLEEKGLWAVHLDGGRSRQWRVLDFGGLLIHLFQPEIREFYGLDRLFHEAREVAWQENHAAARRRHVR